MIVNNPANAGLTPGPGISLEILSNSFSALTAVSFATEPLVGAVSERDGIAFELVGATTEVAMLDAISDVASIAERSVSGCLARDGVGIGVGVPEGCCWTRLWLDKEGCDPRDLRFLSFLSIEDNFGGINFGMMILNEEQEHEA
jgi:hypothetical protein